MAPPDPSLSPLEEHFEKLLARRKTRSLFRRIEDPPPGVVDFTSNDYLSLSSNPAIKKAYLSHLNAAFSSPSSPSLGSTGSRLLSGNHPLATHLETLIPRHHNAPAGLLFTSGYDANVALLSTLPQPGDVVLYDALVHASAHDGMRLSRGARRRFAHNSPSALSHELRRLVEEDAGVASGARHVFIVVEAVYSMDGDVAALREMLDVMDAALPARNGYFIVDEAHATGVVGRGGRGLVCAEGVEERVFARVVTFGKAVGAAGAIVLCATPTKAYLINYARPFIYTTAPSFPSLVAIKVAYDFLIRGDADPLAAHLRRLSSLMASLTIPQKYPTPIIPIFTPNPRSLATFLRARGFAVRPIVAPTVPKGTERVRICLHAANSVEQVEGLVRAVGAWMQDAERGRQGSERQDVEKVGQDAEKERQDGRERARL